MSVEAKLATGFGVALLALSILAAALGFKEVQLSSTSFDEIGTLLLILILVALVIGASCRGLRVQTIRPGETSSSAPPHTGRGQTV